MKRLVFETPQPGLQCRPQCASQSATPASSAAPLTSSIAYGRGNAPASTQPVRYCAPDDPDAPDKAVTSPSVVYAAPSGDEEEEDGEGTTKHELTQASPVEDMLLQLQRRWETVVQLTLSERAGKLYNALEAADQTLTSQLAEIQQSVHQKQKELARADELQAAQQSHEREQRLLQLQYTHAQSARVQEQQVERLQQQAQQAAQRKRVEEAAVAAAAAEARAEQEAARAAAAAAAQGKLQEEAARAAAAAAAAATMAQQQQQQQQKAAGMTAASSPPPGPPALTPAAPQQGAPPPAIAINDKVAQARLCMRASPGALKAEQQVGQRFEELQQLIQPLVSDPSTKVMRRGIEKKMTVHVQQISATLEQVARKCGDVHDLIAAQTDAAWRTYAQLMFATKVIKQGELITQNNKAAFPLATVLVKVSTHFPDLMALTLGLLHRQCVLTVPRAFVMEDPASGARITAAQHHRLMGYEEVETTAGSKVFESHDQYLQRLEGCMLLYGALVQVDEAAHPHGLDHGWSWLARLLNALPASRITAKALIFFLRPAGYALHARFGTQFVKLLLCMRAEFLPELHRSHEPDVQAVSTLLQHYLDNAQFWQEPEGRNMPRIDMSSYQRA